MANKLIRHYGRGHLHFIMFTCYRRLPLLGSVRARNVFVSVLGEVRDRYRFCLVGYVVMPEHFHLLISEPVQGTPSTVIQVLKQRVSRRLRRNRRAPTGQLNLNFASGDDSLPRFWQRCFYDFTGAGSTWSPLEKSLESEEEGRKAPLHAHESVEKKIGRSSQGLALEQFSLLLESGARIDPGGLHPLSCKHGKEEPNPPTPRYIEAVKIPDLLFCR